MGLLLERSSDLVVAMLAVLKAGAAYLPLESNAPAERLSFMLADAEVAAVLTTGALGRHCRRVTRCRRRGQRR